MTPKVTPFLWFKSQADEAINFYVSLFKNSEILKIDRLTDDGSVYATSFRLDGQEFIALNGGPEGDQSKFNDSISFVISCDDQDEVDHFWDALAVGGKPVGCGWIKDKYGVTWQVTPKAMSDYVSGPDPEGAARAMKAMSQMVKIDLPRLKALYEGS